MQTLKPIKLSQKCMNSSDANNTNNTHHPLFPFLGNEYLPLPKDGIVSHPFSLTLEDLLGLLNLQQNYPEFPTLQTTPSKDSSGSPEDSRELSQSKPVGGSGLRNQSTIPGLIQNGQPKQKKDKTPQTPKNQDSSGSLEDSRELSQSKPVGGSGWLHKYTKLKSTKNRLIEYPRVPEGKRSPENHKHWYWDYCWQKKYKNGKPLSKRGGNPVIESIYCPQKKVRAVERAIAARLPHHQILKIIKGYNSTPPPT